MSQSRDAAALLGVIVGLFLIPITLIYHALKGLVLYALGGLFPGPRLDDATASVVERLAGLIYQDRAACAAAEQAAWDHGDYHYHPIKCLNKFMWLFGDDPPDARRRLEAEARQRFEAAIPQRALEGSMAYVLGRRGNAYTRFLIGRFGRFSPPGVKPAPEAYSEAPSSSYWRGSGRGDHFGPKQFSVVVGPEYSAREALGRVAKALGQVVSPAGRPWRVLAGVVASAAIPGAPSFAADGSYRSDGRPYRARQGDSLVILAEPVAGRAAGAHGTVHLTCTAVEDPADGHTLLLFEFGEGSYPMWMSRHAEALVASTIIDLAGLPADRLRPVSEWEFSLGGWVHSQVLTVPGRGSIELLRG